MAFGNTAYKGGAYIYGTQFPPLNCEGDTCWVKLVETLSEAFVEEDEAQFGLIKNIPADVIPVEFQIEVPAYGTSFDSDICAIRSDDTEVILVNGAIGATASDATFALNDGTGFATGDTIEEVQEALGSLRYDLAFINEAATADGTPGDATLRVKFVRDVRAPGTVKNSLIADGQNA